MLDRRGVRLRETVLSRFPNPGDPIHTNDPDDLGLAAELVSNSCPALVPWCEQVHKILSVPRRGDER